MSHRALVRTTIAIAVVAAAVVPGIGGSAQGNAPGYAFSDVRVERATDPATGLPDGEHAKLSFDYEWATGQFPGTRRCTWNVFDEAGNVIGTRIDMMTAQAESADDVTSLVDVSGEPSHATVACEQRRFDNPSGRYRLSDVSVSSSSTGDPVVSFDASWTGGGDPVAQECTVVLSDAEGERIERVISFASPEETLTGAEMRLNTSRRPNGGYRVEELECANSISP